MYIVLGPIDLFEVPCYFKLPRHSQITADLDPYFKYHMIVLTKIAGADLIHSLSASS